MSESLKKTLWALAKPAIVAMVVALLVSLGVQMTQSGPQFAAAGVTHFTSLQVQGETYGANGLRVGGNVTGTGASDWLAYANVYVSQTLGVGLGHTYAGLVGATNGFTCATNITGTSSTGMLRYAQAVISTTLDTHSISVTTGITAATAKVTGAAQVTGELTAGNGLRVGGSMTGTSSGTLTYYAAVVTDEVACAYMYASTNIATPGSFRAMPAVTQTVVNTQPITPTGMYQGIAAAVNVFTSDLVVSGVDTGYIWILQNVGTPVITITDTAQANLTSTYAMGISDTLCLIFDGVSWIELFRSNN